MPIYIYRCRECELPDEPVSHKMTEDPAVICLCGAVRFRVPQKAGVSLRGDGWAKHTGGEQ